MYKVIGADKIEYGPVEITLIRQWISEGRLVGDSLIKPEGQAEYVPARTLPEFAGMFGVVPPPPSGYTGNPGTYPPAGYPGGAPAPLGAPDLRARAESEVKGPAIGLIITAIIGIVYRCAFLLPGLGNSIANSINAQNSRNPYGDPRVQQQMQQIVMLFQGPLMFITALIAIALAIFLLYAGIKLLKLQSYNAAFCAAIIALIPCLSPCCCVGIPIGIWALVVLNRPWVKSQFN